MLARRNITLIANRFDTALNNMPHGLCMFDSDGHLAVVNNRFLEMMGLDSSTIVRGRTIREIIDACVAAKAILPLSGASILAEVEKAKEAEVTTLDSGPLGTRAMSWTFQPMDGGGHPILSTAAVRSRPLR